MRDVEGDFSQKVLWSAAQLVRSYTDSVDGDVTADVNAILDELGGDEAALRGLLASSASIAGHAVMIITARLEADAGTEEDLQRRLERVSKLREEVLAECVRAVREFRPAALHLPPARSGAAMRGIWERRSGSERRMGSDRRQQAPGSSAEKINLRLFGERRLGGGDRRTGSDRRRLAGATE
jgi:hypothetical protein